ncbi:arylsulfatase AtsA [Maricurvus nonylphenolicus]|uniref:arylsulfatase n=1 Tax=Maricurvus nonylphenolicus TaxID=1008307 RepID=UPI0036F3E009
MLKVKNVARFGLVALLLCVVGGGVAADVSTESNNDMPDKKQPNFLVVVADDLGWSDIGAFGGEINTPVLNSLANQGVAMTQFYTAPTCSPTRAMLLTGVDHHLAGLGTMHDVRAANQLQDRNYAGELHNDVVTLPEVLKPLGYQTFMAGKWHLAASPEQYPNRRGFDKSFVLLEGGASHFGDELPLYEGNGVTYLEDGKPVGLPEDFYSSIFYTEKLLSYLEQRDTRQPFFAYLAYTAPHDPIQVPDNWLDRYRGVYDAGPEAIREQRAQQLKTKGLLPEDSSLWQMPSPPKWLPLYKPQWQQRSEEERQDSVRRMELYAAMVELMDQQLGRVIKHLRDTGELDNTYILFLSDNGANGATPLVYPAKDAEWFFKQRDQRPEQAGRAGSHIYLGREWAQTAGSPWKLFKGTVAEGGIRSPLIVRGPGLTAGRMENRVGHVAGIAPAIYSMLGITPESLAAFKGKQLPSGASLLPAWLGLPQQNQAVVATELFGNRAIRQGDWKAHFINIPLGSGQWELFNLANDPGETQNLAQSNPQKLGELMALYEDYDRRVGVIAPQPPFTVTLKKLHVDTCDWWCETRLAVAQWGVELAAALR